MSLTRIQLEALLNQVRAGATDLSAGEIDALADYLNVTPQASARLAETKPLLGPVGRVRRPRPAEWDRVWHAIDEALPAARGLTVVHADELESRLRLAQLLDDQESLRPASRWRRRLVSWATAAAACILLLSQMRLPGGQSSALDDLPLAADVQIVELDADGATPLVVPLSGGSQMIIWSFDDQGA